MSNIKDLGMNPYLAKDYYHDMTMKDMMRWKDMERRGVDHDYRRLAHELGSLNSRFRGIHERDLEELMRAVEQIEGGPRPPRVPGYNYEDLYHQAMAALDAAYEGEDVEGDAAELLNLWQQILEKAEAR